MNSMILTTEPSGMGTQFPTAASLPGPACHALPAPRRSLPSLSLRTILAPFDFSDASAVLVRRLAALAEDAGAALHLLHVVEPARGAGWATDASSAVTVNARAEAARAQIQKWVAQSLPVRLAVMTSVRVGRAADEIVSHAQTLGADLIVMSAHVGRGMKNVLLRTTTERVVRLSACPVLTIPRDQVVDFFYAVGGFPLPGWKRILLPVDLAGRQPDAVAYATAIATANQGRLHLLYGVPGDQAEADETPERAEKRLSAWLRAELCWPVEHVGAVWHNVPLVHAILQEAAQSRIDLMVISPRDDVRFRRHRLWSITDGILRHAPCPILSVNERSHSTAG
jgi:nucleotide-binding universal stress UspA family protein